MRKWLFIVPALCLAILGPAVIANHLNGGSEPTAIDSPAEPDLDVADIAGQSPEAVAAILGQPTVIEQASPSNTPCPCPKLTYGDNWVEVIYINNKADWITVNNKSSKRVIGSGKYVSADSFPDYLYFKVSTP